MYVFLVFFRWFGVFVVLFFFLGGYLGVDVFYRLFSSLYKDIDYGGGEYFCFGCYIINFLLEWNILNIKGVVVVIKII